MRILLVIPHFYAPHHTQAVDRPRYGADRTPFEVRAAIVQRCLDSLYSNFIASRYELDVSTRLVGKIVHRTPTRHHLDIVLVVRQPAHLLDSLHLPPRTRIGTTRNEPRQIGFHCHKVLARYRDDYDLFGYLEDDIAIEDPFFFDKIAWFTETFGDGYMLQPNRYEPVVERGRTKVYVDGPIPDEGVELIPRQYASETLTATVFGREITFEARRNPMAGCFFLNRAQLSKWMERPDFAVPTSGFFGTMECAQILGPVQTVTVMKPSGITSDFLEICHLDPRLTRLKHPMHNLARATPPAENRKPPDRKRRDAPAQPAGVAGKPS